MNAAEHAKAAEELLSRKESLSPDQANFRGWREINISKAQVHATLALALAWMEGVTVTNYGQR